MSAVRRATSRKAREVAHPQLFRSMFKDKPALCFPVKVATRQERQALPFLTRKSLTIPFP